MSKTTRFVLALIATALVLGAVVMMSLFSAEPDTRADTLGLDDVNTNEYDGVSEDADDYGSPAGGVTD